MPDNKIPVPQIGGRPGDPELFRHLPVLRPDVHVT